MDTVFSNVCGGVGNQLFQIAAAYSYSKLSRKDLKIDASRWTASQGRNPLEYKDSIFKNFEYGLWDGATEFTEEDFSYEPIPFIRGDVMLTGYYQSWKYFYDCVENFVDELSLPEVRTDFIKENNVAFHIRRGDYLKYPHIFNIGNQYFKDQFENFKGYQINVFTDSPDIVLKEFEGYDFNLIQTSSEINDLTLISKHDNVVCSNSSFSWWASLLGKSKERIIVPDKWLNGTDCRDIYRSEMTISKT